MDLVAYCVQADRVGGDYYDYLPFDDAQIGLVIADAEGHGFSAALLVAMLKTRLHSQVRRDPTPERVMSALNQTLVENVDGVRMASCCYILIDSITSKFHFCYSGHIPQYHYRSEHDKIETLEFKSSLLGFADQHSPAFESETRSWNSGDLLVLCTDGVTEARCPDDTEFGPQRLEELIFRYRHLEPREIQRRLCRCLEDFRGSNVFDDDVSLLVARLR